MEIEGAPPTPSMPRAGALVYFFQDNVLLKQMELLWIPDTGDTVYIGGFPYFVSKRTWVLNVDPPYVEWVSLEVVYQSITPEEAQGESSTPISDSA